VTGFAAPVAKYVYFVAAGLQVWLAYRRIRTVMVQRDRPVIPA
jgi:hypothetical protein